jgi:hypothetical protein
MSKDKQDHIVEPNKKVSSVEWLSNQSYELFEQYSEGNFDRITLNKLMLKATEQAKVMHKEEIVKSNEAGFDDGIGFIEEIKYKNAEDYYIKTFGGNK